MFHPEVVAARQHQLESAFKAELPGGRLRRHPIDLCWAMRKHLEDAADAKGNLLRPLTQEETQFIQNETLLSTVDFRYWAERYAHIAKESQDLEPITPLWKSQEVMIRHFATVEYTRQQEGHPDGLLFLVLKARQLGASTLTEVILAHRVTTQKSMRGLVAGDVQEQSQYMFGMAELVVSNLPWWLRPPPVAPTTRGHHMSFATGARLSAFWGKSSRGGLQDDAKVKGNLGRGKTFNTVHLSELSTWENPKQIEDGLLPGVPRRARTFVILESTAKGRHDWWHSQWDQAGRGVGRFSQIFIPWYIEPDKYWLPVPEGWEPLPSTKQHAEEVERDSPNWCFGETVRLPKEQLYWYEKERQRFDDSERGVEFDASGHRIPTFLEEYPASPRDAFQNAGKSVFSQKALERMRTYERPPVGICDIAPAKDIALLQAWERDAAAKQLLEDAKPKPYSQQ